MPQPLPALPAAPPLARVLAWALAWALLLWPTGPAWAEKADRLQALHIEADQMQHDEARQLTVLSGNVQASKGTLQMRAHRMEVQQDAKGQQVARFWAREGERVFFRQKREGLQEFVEGEAVQAVYDSRLDQITLSERAEMRILRQGRVADQVSAPRIVYSGSTEQMSVEGKLQGDTGRQRVRAVLAPKTEASAANPAVNQVPLKPSASLESRP